MYYVLSTWCTSNTREGRKKKNTLLSIICTFNLYIGVDYYSRYIFKPTLFSQWSSFLHRKFHFEFTILLSVYFYNPASHDPSLLSFKFSGFRPFSGDTSDRVTIPYCNPSTQIPFLKSKLKYWLVFPFSDCPNYDFSLY